MKYHTVTIGAKYKHYKNKKTYKTVDVATHTETKDDLVIYYCLDDEYGEYNMWARPKDMFEEGLLIDGELVPRFELLSPKVATE